MLLKKTLLPYPSELPLIWNTFLRFSIFQCLVVLFSDKYRFLIYSLDSFFSFVKLAFITFSGFFHNWIRSFLSGTFVRYMLEIISLYPIDDNCSFKCFTDNYSVQHKEAVQSISFQYHIVQQFWHWSYFKVIFRYNISHWLPSFWNQVKYKSLKVCWHQSDKIQLIKMSSLIFY